MAAAIGAGAGLSALGSIAAGNNKAAELNRAADIAQMDAAQALKAGQLDSQRQDAIGRQKIGGATAGYGASGVLMSGSALDVIESSARNSEMDKMNILYGSQLKATNFENQASMDRVSAQNNQIGGYLNAFSMGLAGWGAMAKSSAGGASLDAGSSEGM